MNERKSLITTVSDFLEKLLVPFITIATIVLIAVVFLQVVFRYVFSFSFLWGEELAILCFTWIVFLGTGIAIKEGTHFIVDIFPESLPEKWSHLLNTLATWGVLISSVFLMVFGMNYTILGLTRYSYSTGLPMSLYFWVGPAAGLLTFVFSLEKLTELKKDKR